MSCSKGQGLANQALDVGCQGVGACGRLPTAHAGCPPAPRPQPHLGDACSVGLLVAIAHVDCGERQGPWGGGHGHLICDTVTLANNL